ncbi:MAG: ferrous iron transport protein A [Thermostichus sp. DG02_5_bins_236]
MSSQSLISITLSPLHLMQPGEEGRIHQLRGSDRVCTQLQQMGLTPGSLIRVEQNRPHWILTSCKGSVSISAQLAGQVLVRMDPCCQLPLPKTHKEGSSIKKILLNLSKRILFIKQFA